MKYYFTARTSVIDKSATQRYKQVIRMLEAMGHQNINYVHMDDDSVEKKIILDQIKKQDISQFDYQISLLSKARALICDVTAESSTIGFQVMHAINNRIPCLVYTLSHNKSAQQKRVPVIFTKTHNDLLKFVTLDNVSELSDVVEAFEQDYVDKPFKFNFFIDLKLYNQISNIAKEQKRTKSDIAREAIEEYIVKIKS